MIENPYKKGSEPGARIHTPAPLTFYLRGAGELMESGSALVGSLRGSKSRQANTDDPVVAKDRTGKVAVLSDTASKEKLDADAKALLEKAKLSKEKERREEELLSIKRQEEKDLLIKNAKEAVEKEARQNELQELERLRNEAKLAREETARVREQAATAKAQHEQEIRDIEATRIRLEAEERRKQDLLRAERAHIEEEAHAHRVDTEEQAHNQPARASLDLDTPVISEGGGSKSSGLNVNSGVENSGPARSLSLPKDYINPYDPAPGHVFVAKQKTAPPRIVCDGSMDPFQDIPIDSYEPPTKALLPNKLEWKEKQSAMMQRLHKFSKGGKELYALIDSEVRQMSLLRVKLFCEDALKLAQEKVPSSV